ncbi:serine/threonine protein kinase [Streptomyces sp. NBC_00056]|uniref:serine/threonine-protein kinase n=1 Tax=unclassified Streptomyces TaxID=2593676 RepID=UPI002E80CBEF|nr:serine/threonine-protein kinase [Streptomyces sp. NBC_00569]WUB95016.1 serine/threonine protein kinase [Streptomyces sp. NBC_00569]
MGEVFAGRYELADPIGRGGTGAVWRAWDHRRRRYVAAKVLLQSDAHTLLRFVREQALRIDHPHVLAPASWAADDDKVLFTMDLVAGGSLAHLIGDYGPLPPSFVCLLLDQLLAGLTAVHAEGVVHRDIKPANILLEATGTARPHLRLSDFGIAMRKGEPRLTETDYVVGTPGYFAPEQAMGGEPDFPADLFAVGLVALYLLQGARPDSRALIEHFTDHGTPGAPQGIPGPLWTVVAGLLQPDPEARFRTATGARKALLAASELLPEPGPDDELVEVFDQLGSLPPGFAPNGPTTTSRAVAPGLVHDRNRDHGSTTGRSTTLKPPPAPGEALPALPAEPPTPAPPPPPLYAPAVPDAPPAERSVPRPTTPAPPGPASTTSQTAMHGSSITPGTTPSRTAPSEAVTPGTAPSNAGLSGTSMSETGSFHLPPPPPAQPPAQPLAPTPPEPRPITPTTAPEVPGYTAHARTHLTAPQAPPPTPPTRPHPHASPHTPATTPATQRSYAAPAQGPAPAQSPAPAPAQPAPISTYTAQSVQVPLVSHPNPGGTAPSPTPHRRLRKRRPGPPAKVAIPVLFVALVSFVVGIWALAQA